MCLMHLIFVKILIECYQVCDFLLKFNLGCVVGVPKFKNKQNRAKLEQKARWGTELKIVELFLDR